MRSVFTLLEHFAIIFYNVKIPGISARYSGNFLFFYKQSHCFRPYCFTELIYAACLFQTITCCKKCLQVTCKTGRLTGNIYDTVHTVGKDLRQCFRMNAVTRRIQHDHIRLSVRSSRTFRTSPAMKRQLSSPFSFAFSLAASTASSTISTPITSFATGARSCAIVPVPL